MSEKTWAYKRLRKNFGKISKIVEIPDLIGMQRESYNRLLQIDVPADQRRDIGLEAVYRSVFPIKDFTGTASLEYVSYSFGESKYSVFECLEKGMTYEISIRIRIRLVVYDIDKELGTSNIRDIKEQEIYFGTIPLMTKRGTFIVNGTERVVVSQLHRSSGVFFDHDKGKVHSSGKVIYSARIIPVRGSWIDMEIDPKDIVYIRIDRRRKFPVTLLFKAFGYTTDDVLDYFYQKETIIIKNDKIVKLFNAAFLKGQRSISDVVNPDSGEIIVKQGRMFTKRAIKNLVAINMKEIIIDDDYLLNKAAAKKIYHPDEEDMVLVDSGELITEEILELLKEAGVETFQILYVDVALSSDSIRKTLLLDKVSNKEQALIEIYKRLRPGNPVTPQVAQDFIDHLFFKLVYYDLSGVGRLKLNHRLDVNAPISLRTLRKEDVLLTARTLVDLKDTQGVVDDIDHLGNRRVRAVGELMENQYRIGLVRMERAIKERMSMQEIDALMPHDLVNPKPVSAVVKEFFGTSQLSQFMDQTNPLSETTHKRRLSALGPGGLTRERAGFEVRDVHPSHYGRICPIETPEGPNIGLIVSLSTYAKVNDFGFIETPYRSVKDKFVTNEIRLLSAFEEKQLPIAQANAPLNEKGEYLNQLVTSRVGGEFTMVEADKIELMDVSPNQLVSVSASLIPFLENDDANRALMGSNMQRQAVPLMESAAPLVGTGVEAVVARDSGVCTVSEEEGVIEDVNASRIVVRHGFDNYKLDSYVTIHNLSKFIRSNQNTCFTHRPIVKKGQFVKKGEIIADGPAVEQGELALGKNITVAFMPWHGYNFEDSILVSETLVRDNVFTSVHIEEFEVVARDTKLGKEEITRDMPNVGEDALINLDESGIVMLGADVKPGDILVGKVTPKGETQLSPEEKLLRAIFGEKAGDVKDTSLRVPPGVEGIVIDAKIFSRRGVDKDDRTRLIEDEEIAVLEKNRDDEIEIVDRITREQLKKLVNGQICDEGFYKSKRGSIEKNSVIDSKLIDDFLITDFKELFLVDSEITERVHEIVEKYNNQIKLCRQKFNNRVVRYEKGDDLPPGVIKLIKVHVAMKRILSVGDKMAGRHGNKGVVSRILPQEDMPYFEDGTNVDMVLNPLGVPSRMNVGQILEIHLGRAARCLGGQISDMIEANRLSDLKTKFKTIFSDSSDFNKDLDEMEDCQLIEFAEYYRKGVHMGTPVFDGAKEIEIKSFLKEAGVWESGQAKLYDGRTGESFNEAITVGTMYMLKLHHLVDDKIHARSIGPYSLVTQQPLGGKAQFGGQRLGEMEVWAMEAYGAAYALQEFMTVKSDDMAGRTRMYEKIVKGQNLLEPGIPESFRVLTKELQSLGLDITLIEKEQ